MNRVVGTTGLRLRSGGLWRDKLVVRSPPLRARTVESPPHHWNVDGQVQATVCSRSCGPHDPTKNDHSGQQAAFRATFLSLTRSADAELRRDKQSAANPGNNPIPWRVAACSGQSETPWTTPAHPGYWQVDGSSAQSPPWSEKSCRAESALACRDHPDGYPRNPSTH